MKSFISLCLLSMTLLLADPTWALNYKSASEQAVKEQKGMMIILSEERCDGCWYMENIVF